MELADELAETFTWVPPLIVETDNEVYLAGPEVITHELGKAFDTIVHEQNAAVEGKEEATVPRKRQHDSDGASLRHAHAYAVLTTPDTART